MLVPLTETLLVVGAYMIGSVCMGPILASRQGVDLREVGSGNVGATNVERALGKRAGRMTMAWDAAKGAAPALLARLILPAPAPSTAAAVAASALGAVGLAAVLGHCFPIFHGFRGGKGVATAAGVLLVTVPLAGLLALLTYVVGRRVSGRASVAAFAACGTAAVAAAFTAHRALFTMTLLIVGLIVLRHYENIGRLLRGKEPPSP